MRHLCLLGLLPLLALTLPSCGEIDTVGPGAPAPGGCGDGRCEGVESWDKCPEDCPQAGAEGTCGDGALAPSEACECGEGLMACASDSAEILARDASGTVVSGFECEDAEPSKPHGVLRCAECSLKLQECRIEE